MTKPAEARKKTVCSSRELKKWFCLTVFGVTCVGGFFTASNFGLKLLIETTKQGPVESDNNTRIPIKRAFGTDNDFSHLYEEDYLNAGGCSSHDGFLYFEIPRSSVRTVQLYFSDQTTVAEVGTIIQPDPSNSRISVEVCRGNSNESLDFICAECGFMTEEEDETSYRLIGFVTCLMNEFESNFVKISLSSRLYPCKVKLRGKILVHEAVRELKVSTGEGERLLLYDDAVTPEHFVGNAFDGNEDTNVFNCFVSDKQSNGWADFWIEWSRITHVDILSVGNGQTAGLEGLFVFVCKSPEESTCLPCGVARKTPAGHWTTVHCDGGMIEGNRLRLKHPYKRLQFCEMKAYGIELDADLSDVSRLNLKILAFEKPISNYSLDYSYIYYTEYYTDDYSWRDYDYILWKLTNRTCATMDSHFFANYAVFTIQPSVVHYIMVLSCIHGGCGNTDMEIKVCKNEYECEICGALSGDSDARGNWATIMCDRKSNYVASRIEFYVPEKYLRFCDLQVYGKLVP